ncbi:MAG: uroporphyrinogen decarboxylase family protein [bacterium]
MMTHKERFLTAMVAGGVPDRVPATPDTSNYIPCKRTGLPFWDIYFKGEIPLWKAYLDVTDYYDTEAWIACCTGLPLEYASSLVERKSEIVYDADRDAMLEKLLIRTPDGDMTAQTLCYRNDPPSPIEKLMKNLEVDFAKYKWLMSEPIGYNAAAVEEIRTECEKREQAFGMCMGYPGFQGWMCFVEGGVEPLCYAEMDTPEILEEWLEIDLAYGTKAMEYMIATKPDYLLFGGSGTITLASPDLAHKYAIPALKKWSAMAKEAGIPTMLHSCGKSRILVDLLCDETDVNCINPLEIAPMGDVDLAEVKKARGSQISLMGNLHTTQVMLYGTADDVRKAARQAISDAGEGGGFILSTGDQCGPETPEENLFALVETAKEYGVYDQKTGKLKNL